MVPPHLASQPDVTSEFFFNGRSGFSTIIEDRSPLRQPMFMSRIVPQSEQVKTAATVAISYRGTLYQRHLAPGKSTSFIPTLSGSERLKFLRPTKVLDFEQPAFQH